VFGIGLYEDVSPNGNVTTYLFEPNRGGLWVQSGQIVEYGSGKEFPEINSMAIPNFAVPSGKEVVIELKKERGKDSLDFYVDGVKYHTSFKIHSNSLYRPFISYSNKKKYNENSKIFSVEFNGKSLGSNSGMMPIQIYNSAQSSNMFGVILMPYDTALIQNLLSELPSLSLEKILYVFVISGNQSVMKDKILLNRLKIYNVKIINLKQDLLRAKKHDLKTLLEYISKLYGIKNNQLGRPVILADGYFHYLAVDFEHLKDAEVIPMKIDNTLFIGRYDYKAAYILSAAAISKGDNKNYGYQSNRDGSLSLTFDLIVEFQNQISNLRALSIAA
jgi:hypothetical protein